MRREFLLLVVLFVISYIHSLWAAESDITVLSQTENQFVFEYTPANFSLTDVTVNGKTLKNIVFENAVHPQESGVIDTPVRLVSLGIPMRGDAYFQILDSDITTLPDIELAPVPEYKPDGDGGYYLEYGKVKTNGAGTPSTENAFQVVQNLGTEIFRKQNIVTLAIQPVEYNNEQKTLKQYTRLKIQVNFSGTQTSTASIRQNADEELYSSMLLNYEQAQKWRKPASALRKISSNPFTGSNWYKITINGNGTTAIRDANGDEEGMYKVTGSALQSAGVPISSIDPKSFQLFNNGGKVIPNSLYNHNPDSLIENSILVVGGDDGSFGASDYILFYGRSLNGVEYDTTQDRLEHYLHPFAEDNVYWLTWGKQDGKRMMEMSSLSASGAELQNSFRDLAYFEREEYNVYNSGTVWLDRSLSVMNSSRSYSFELKNVVSNEVTYVRPQLGLVSASGTHYFNVQVNGNNLGDISKSHISDSYYNLFQEERSNNGVLINGNNTVTINYNNTKDTDLAYVDYIEMEYARQFTAVNDQLVFWGPKGTGSAAYPLSGFSGSVKVFKVTDFSNVGQIIPPSQSASVTVADIINEEYPEKYIALTEAAYKTVSADKIESATLANLRQSRQADYIIITYDDFEQQAKELESLRENWDPQDRLETEVVKISDVYQEFGYGIEEPGALRDFLMFAQENWGNPYYVLLFGDGHFDYKNILGLDVPQYILPYETDETTENYTRATDDWFVITNPESERPQMAIGRINARTVDEAQRVVDKIETYETNPEFGDWRNTVTFIADDEVQPQYPNQPQHTRGAELMSQIDQIEKFNIKKIYLIEYRAVSSASISGYTKPEARQDLLDQINSGSLILNYVGHGNDQRWAHEKVLYSPTDFDLIRNGNKQALWIAATCEFGHWDQVQEQCMSEELLYAPDRGAIGVVASSRVVYASNNEAFNLRLLARLFQDYDETGQTMRIGKAVLLAKLDIFSSSKANSEKFLYLGDPAMRLGAPRYRAQIDDITPDSIQALQKMSITGHANQDGSKWNDYQGKVMVKVLDSPTSKVYYTETTNVAIYYNTPGNTLFRGTATINDGDFNVQFIVPKDISYNGTDGRVHFYYWNNDSEGMGYAGGLVVGGTSTDLVDHEGPELKLHFGDPDFAPGDYVSSNTTLNVEISDTTSGINTAGDIGHQITMVLDEDEEAVRDITEYFEYNEGSYTSGTLKYPLQQLSEGNHNIKVKAWDNSNNSGAVESEFVVVQNEDLLIRDIVNYPNPMTDDTQFTFQISQDAMAEIRIYTVAGRLIKKFEPTPVSIGFNIFPEKWDGYDQDGDAVANGVYLYKIKAESDYDGESKTVEEIGKLIIAR